MDDVLNVSGHRIGTAEVESVLTEHADVAEAAVVGCPHEVKGQAVYAFVTTKGGVTPSDELKARLRQQVATKSAASPSRNSCSGHPPCPRPAPARS